ncbi:hypothetical protein T484DRAFT_1761654, partial [Baffinella frigidus]
IKYDLAAVGIEDVEGHDMLTAVKAFEKENSAAGGLTASADEEGLKGWWTKGSTWVAARVRRDIFDTAERKVNEGNGSVVGWLPATHTSFVDARGRPAALWRITYDDKTIGTEDLEQHEIQSSAQQRRWIRGLQGEAEAQDPGLAGWETKGHHFLGCKTKGHHFLGCKVARTLINTENNDRKKMDAKRDIGYEDLEEHEVQKDIKEQIFGTAPGANSSKPANRKPDPTAKSANRQSDPTTKSGRPSHKKKDQKGGVLSTSAKAPLSNFAKAPLLSAGAAKGGASASIASITEEEEETFDDLFSKNLAWNVGSLLFGFIKNRAPAWIAPTKEEEEEGWRNIGSVLIGVRVRREIPSVGNMPQLKENATVWGWLPAEESNFSNEESGLPAALWRIRFDNKAIGGEDLEERIRFDNKATGGEDWRSPKRIRFDNKAIGEEDLEESEVHESAALYKRWNVATLSAPLPFLPESPGGCVDPTAPPAPSPAALAAAAAAKAPAGQGISGGNAPPPAVEDDTNWRTTGSLPSPYHQPSHADQIEAAACANSSGGTFENGCAA